MSARPAVRRAGPPGGPAWYVVAARFTDADKARKGWELVERKRRSGSCGVYRHGPPDRPGTDVSAVSMQRRELDRIAELLEQAGGRDQRLHHEVADQLVIRRARVVLEAAAAQRPYGRIKIRRPERGATLNPDGTMDEPGGHG